MKESKFQVGDIVGPASGWHNSWYKFYGIVTEVKMKFYDSRLIKVTMWAEKDCHFLLETNNFVLLYKGCKLTKLL